MITFEQGVELAWRAFDDMEGGEIYVRKIPSMKMTDLAKTLMPMVNLITWASALAKNYMNKRLALKTQALPLNMMNILKYFRQ